MTKPSYIHLPLGSQALATIDNTPFAAIIIINSDVTNDWRNMISEWLVENGCCYMMAWGKDCSTWDDSVDWANIEKYNFKNIPDEKFVMTTWHENETIDDVFWFAKNCAKHGSVDLKRMLIIDINIEARENRMLCKYQQANYEN